LERELQVYVNGEYLPRSRATVSVFDHGLLYGDGVFEGIRAYGGSVFQLDPHIDRLFASANYIQLTMPLDREKMTRVILETLRRNKLRDAYVRVVVTRGAGDLGISPESCQEPTVVVIAEPVSSILGLREPKFLRVIISSIRRDSVDATTHEVKSLNYLNSIVARIEAKGVGADDAIMLDSRGFVSEGTATNVFIVVDGSVHTPQTSSAILHGITRVRIIKLCKELGLEVLEKDITPFELISANEIFMVGTKAEIVAVGNVNGRVVGTGREGPTTKLLRQEFGKLVTRKGEGTPIYAEESLKV
jgi:branched-chain amino acid aminotransferase